MPVSNVIRAKPNLSRFVRPTEHLMGKVRNKGSRPTAMVQDARVGAEYQKRKMGVLHDYILHPMYRLSTVKSKALTQSR